MKIVNRKQMNIIDHSATSQYYIESLILMEHAGNGIYLDFIKRFSSDKTVMIVCGNGNNGGDGFVLARLLYLSGYQVAVSFIGNEAKLTKDAKINYESVKALAIDINGCYEAYDIIIDCIFGTGLCRNIEGHYQDVITKINQLDKVIISVDIPSGIDSDTGCILGCAIKADITYTMQCGKVGLYLYPGRIYSGEVVIIDIFIPKALIDQCESTTFLIQKDDMKHLMPDRSIHSNKGSYGKVLCIGGSEGMSGAISMAAKSALNAGCGLMTCAIPSCIKDIVATNLLESMSIILNDEDGHINASSTSILQDKINQYTCILIGCGIGRSKDIEAIMQMLLASDVPLIIDADGLHAFKPYIEAYRNRSNIILTPHLKEFATLIDCDVNEVVEHTIDHVNEFCKLYPNYTLVLKSETTIIAQNHMRYINTYGNNGLAVGGSGDVLAGLITGLYAQLKDSLNSAILGVFLHAYSADKLLVNKSVYSILPSDIISYIEEVMKELQ